MSNAQISDNSLSIKNVTKRLKKNIQRNYIQKNNV